MTDELENYLLGKKFPDQKLYINNEKIIITTIPINNNLIVAYSILLISLLLITKLNLLTLAIVFTFSTLNIWKRFEPVNKIEIEKDKKKIQVTSRNPIKNLFVKGEFNYDDIASFYYKKETSPVNFTRFSLFASLKTGEPFLLTDFGREEYAEAFKNYFNFLVKK